MKKKLLTILILLICISSIFIVEECIRLKVNINSLPLIVFYANEKSLDNSKQKESNYYSFGFKTKITYLLDDKSSLDNYMYNIIGKEFYLFNVIMLWR